MSAQHVITTPPLEPSDAIPAGPGNSPTAAAPGGKQRSVKGRLQLGNVLVTLILTAGAILMIAPLAWTFSTSLKTRTAFSNCRRSGSRTPSCGKTTPGSGRPARC